MPQPQPTLGVMTLYINKRKQIDERAYIRKLLAAGKQLGLEIFLFTPEDVNHRTMRIYAWEYNPASKKWNRIWTRFPDMIFDRCRYQPTARFHQLREFRRRYPNLIYMNRPLANKWVIYQLFAKNSALRDYLPETKHYTDIAELSKFADKHQVIFLKPFNGTGGRGILRIDKKRTGLYHIHGRNTSRKIIVPRKLNRSHLAAAIKAWQKGNNYLMQQGINISLENGRVHDFRMLIQKNGNGEWQVTGVAGRIGAARSITSNLHGGGSAVAMDKLLGRRFHSEEQVARIRRTAEQMAFAAVKQLEEEYGRLCELALDLAVDHKGHIWLLEINPKPGRDIFWRIGDKKAYHNAIVRPLEYAKWLYQQQQD